MKLFYCVLLAFGLVTIVHAENNTTKPSLCLLPLHVGNCVDLTIKRYYFDSISDTCLEFNFGGCSTFDENANNFLTQESCEKICLNNQFVERIAQPPHCSQPRELGPCKMYVPSYFYNSTSNTCEKFGYGGCGGNSNRFQMISACIESCVFV